jgi:hypothetical protein
MNYFLPIRISECANGSRIPQTCPKTLRTDACQDKDQIVFGLICQWHFLSDCDCRIITVIFFLLRNYEMKEEIYCFVIFMIAKYEQFYVIIRRNNASHQILSSRTKHIFSFRTKGILWP